MVETLRLRCCMRIKTGRWGARRRWGKGGCCVCTLFSALTNGRQAGGFWEGEGGEGVRLVCGPMPPWLALPLLKHPPFLSSPHSPPPPWLPLTPPPNPSFFPDRLPQPNGAGRVCGPAPPPFPPRPSLTFSPISWLSITPSLASPLPFFPARLPEPSGAGGVCGPAPPSLTPPPPSALPPTCPPRLSLPGYLSPVVLVECVDLRRILEDRGDVVQSYFTELMEQYGAVRLVWQGAVWSGRGQGPCSTVALHGVCRTGWSGV